MTIEFVSLEPDLRELRIGRPAKSALEHAGLNTLKDISAKQRKQVLALHGMGPKALGIIEAELHARGMAFQSEN